METEIKTNIDFFPQYRTGQLLNVHAEKTSEKMMYNALQATLRDSFPSVEMVDYTCAESVMLEGHKLNKEVIKSETAAQGTAPYYVIFVEFAKSQDVVRNGLKGFAKQVSLKSMHFLQTTVRLSKTFLLTLF